jgi:hypothetical protein
MCRPPFYTFSLLLVSASLVLLLAGTASAAAPEDFANATGAALGGDQELGGYVLGCLFSVLLMIVVMMIFNTTSGDTDWRPPMFAGLLGAGVSTLLTWFPPWMTILLIVGFAVLLVSMPGMGES